MKASLLDVVICIRQRHSRVLIRAIVLARVMTCAIAHSLWKEFKPCITQPKMGNDFFFFFGAGFVLGFPAFRSYPPRPTTV
jgi:hypothetical protein